MRMGIQLLYTIQYSIVSEGSNFEARQTLVRILVSFTVCVILSRLFNIFKGI